MRVVRVWVGRQGSNLKPGTVRVYVYVMNGSRNGFTIRRTVGLCLEPRDGGCQVVFKPFLEPFMLKSPVDPGSRLGTELPNPNPSNRRS